MFKRWSPGYCKNGLVNLRNAVQNTCHPESRMRVERRSDHEDFEELTRCEMCMAIVSSYSQEEVHRISCSSTKKKINKSRGLFMGPSTFFRTAFVSGWSKAPATFKRVTFRSDLFSTVTVNVFFSPFTTS